jgi:ligand-binding SRPBCC domain-containing protein
MKIYTLLREQLVKAPLGETWAFFSDPANLKRITPPEMGFQILTPDLPAEIYAGLFIEYKVSPLFGIPLTWVTEITHVEKGARFCDEQRIGPYRIWSHKHFFTREGKYTRMRDRVDYALPPLPFANFINSVIVARRLKEIFDYRHQAVEKIFS